MGSDVADDVGLGGVATEDIRRPVVLHRSDENLETARIPFCLAQGRPTGTTKAPTEDAQSSAAIIATMDFIIISVWFSQR